MEVKPTQASRLRFGPFELDLESGELHKNGAVIRIQPQPFKVLAFLAGRGGRVVTREELRQHIWGDDTFVDVEKGLSFCVGEIRAALGDDADQPRYIETLPKRGYRFIAPIEEVATAGQPASAAPGGPAPAELWRRWTYAAVSVALVAGIAVGFWRPWRPRLTFQERDWVLITQFENRTGDPTFDRTLEYALAHELSNSRFVNVVPRERVADVLQLMKKPAGTRIDPGVGREICLRDGGIRLLLRGRIEKIAGTYSLDIDLVNPLDGATLASLSENAAGQNEILGGVRRLADGLRKRLGDELPRVGQTGQKLAPVTTPSLKALQLYSRAMSLLDQQECAEAVELLKGAIKEDPQFASAHIFLGLCYSRLNDNDGAAVHYKRAFELADATTDRERLFILGNYYQGFMLDRKKAAELYEALLSLYPDDYWALNNLASAYLQSGEIDKAKPYIVRTAELRPNDFDANALAASSLALATAPNLPSGERYVERVRRLAAQEGGRLGSSHLAWIDQFHAHQHWFQGDLVQAQAEMDRVAKAADSLGGSDRDTLLSQLGYWDLLLGKLKAADESFRSIHDSWLRQLSLADLDFAKEDMRGLRGQLADRRQGPHRGVTPVEVVLEIRTGELREAPSLISTLEKERYPELMVKTVRGELALAQGHQKEAVSLLQDSVEGVRDTAGRIYFLGTESLARSLEKTGDVPGAIRVLQRAAQLKWLVMNMPAAGPLWLRNQSELARLDRIGGHSEEAEKIEAELSKLLAYADPDHPIFSALRGSQSPARAH